MSAAQQKQIIDEALEILRKSLHTAADRGQDVRMSQEQGYTDGVDPTGTYAIRTPNGALTITIEIGLGGQPTAACECGGDAAGVTHSRWCPKAG